MSVTCHEEIGCVGRVADEDASDLSATSRSCRARGIWRTTRHTDKRAALHRSRSGERIHWRNNRPYRLCRGGGRGLGCGRRGPTPSRSYKDCADRLFMDDSPLVDVLFQLRYTTKATGISPIKVTVDAFSLNLCHEDATRGCYEKLQVPWNFSL